ncbi:hypothetical protein H9L10_05110 [Phycicoccus endophyticus]|uniref:Uncharacterized protein n=1 Tax=Phycicoccus endophyticus TaxID=1690220 RepID=A0A7G9R472_9MICO|nr:hypothetical protein [Phycicoccus endophyticus]NHI18248.1 hypothetical protein [Phycicoccus endophyticus]QNN50397.1 hypothetical protein H9L10_05110 [Phycicoccus endophyticus]GGL25231.1 hypothetical protein GCM10012283_04270 [Phycicoccus endophyticus]
MRPRTLLALVLVGAAGYASWRLPATRRFVTTVREVAAQREVELRQAVETAVHADATTRAPRHAADAEVPELDVEAGWGGHDPDRERPVALAEGDPGRSLTPDEARELLLDPAGHARAADRERRAR